MPDKLTDNEIIKGLKNHIAHNSRDMLLSNKGVTYGDLQDLINRLQAENTELLGKIEELEANRVELIENIEQLESVITQIKAEAYKEFCEKLHTEILEARESNFKAKDERIAKSKKYGIPIDVEDSFLMYCDGKIHALDGIDYFAYNLLKELVGDK